MRGEEGGGGDSHPLPKIDLVPYNTTGYIHVYYVNHYRVGLSGSSHSKEKIKHSMVTNQRWQNLISNSGSSVWSCAVLS